MSLSSTFEHLRTAASRERYPDLATRQARVQALANEVRTRQAEIVEAISADFGHRSPHETRIADVLPVTNTAAYVRKHLKGWMRPENRGVGMALKPASGHVYAQPLGTVGVVAPWNFPLHLALVPVVYALAAGNRVMLKPSEMTPQTAALMADLVDKSLGADVAAVVEGGADVAAEFCGLPFDHLFFTGSGAVGRKVMEAASRNLTPVTLELGGKSPVVVHRDFPVERAGPPIASGKTFNAGQTCVAPDYAIAHRSRADALSRAIVGHIRSMYPRLADNPDYSSLATATHYDRVQALLADARDKGAEIVEVNPAGESFDEGRKMAPVIVRNPTDAMRVMQEEIFAPILPIVEVDSFEQALDFVRARPSPLAFYLFDTDRRRVERALNTVSAGGVGVNDVVLHASDESLPFGGVGASGMGAYHGPEGFFTFSHRKAVMFQSRLNGRAFLEPPYGWTIDKMLDLMV